MTTISIDTIWQLIRESERSHGIQFMDDELLITAAATHLAPPRPNQSGTWGRASIADAANRFDVFGTWLTAPLNSHHSPIYTDRR